MNKKKLIPKCQKAWTPLVLNDKGREDWVAEHATELPEVTVTAPKPLTDFLQRDKTNGIKLGRVTNDSGEAYRNWQTSVHQGNEDTKKFGIWGGNLVTGLMGGVTASNPATMYAYGVMGAAALPGNIDKISNNINNGDYVKAAANTVLTGTELLPTMLLANKGLRQALIYSRNHSIPARLTGLKDEIKYGITDLKSYHTYPNGSGGKIPTEALPGELDDNVFKMVLYSNKSTEASPAVYKVKNFLKDKATKEGNFYNEYNLSIDNNDLENLGISKNDLFEFGRFKDGNGRFASREFKYVPDEFGNTGRTYNSMVWLLPDTPTRNLRNNFRTRGSYQIGMTPYVSRDGLVEPLSRSLLLYLRKGFDAIPKGSYVTADAPGVIPQIINTRPLPGQSQFEYWMNPINIKNKIFGYSNALPGHVGASFNAYKLLHLLGSKPGNAVLYTPGKISKLNDVLTANEPELLSAFKKYNSGNMSVEEWVNTFNKWQSKFGGRPAHVDFATGKPRYYWPIIYKGN